MSNVARRSASMRSISATGRSGSTSPLSRTRHVPPMTRAFSHGSSPSTSTVPLVLRRNAASTDSAVVLPDPLRPSSPVITPGPESNETASRAVVSP